MHVCTFAIRCLRTVNRPRIHNVLGLVLNSEVLRSLSLNAYYTRTHTHTHTYIHTYIHEQRGTQTQTEANFVRKNSP